jgi:hypothetical protein
VAAGVTLVLGSSLLVDSLLVLLFVFVLEPIPLPVPIPPLSRLLLFGLPVSNTVFVGVSWGVGLGSSRIEVFVLAIVWLLELALNVFELSGDAPLGIARYTTKATAIIPSRA